jgi:hypothetical protein
MPVQALTTCAMSSGTDLLLDHPRLLADGGGLLQLLLQRRHVGVRQPRGGGEVALALRLLDLALQQVDLLLELADPVEAGLLLLPPRGQRGQLGGPVADVAAQLGQPLLRRHVGLALERQLLHPQPVDGALQLVDLDRAAVDLHAQPGGRPRRRGRSPCRAGSAPGCSGRTASPPRPARSRRSPPCGAPRSGS